MADTLERDETATGEQPLHAVGAEEVTLAAEQLAHLASAMEAHLAEGGAACATLTLTVAFGGSLTTGAVQAPQRTLGVDLSLATAPSTRQASVTASSASSEPSRPAGPMLLGKPVTMRGTGRWSSTPLNDRGEPAIWRFTSQEGGTVVPS